MTTRADARALLLQTMVAAAEATAVVLLERPAGDEHYRVTSQAPGARPSVAGAALPARGPLVRWLRVNAEPLVLTERPDVVNDLASAERSGLDAVGGWACVPILDGTALLGILILAGRAPGSDRGMPMALVDCGRQFAARMLRLEELEVERARIEHAARTQQLAVAGTLAAAVAHEVRNPLSTIRSSVQFVLESSAPWRTKADLLSQVAGEVDRINRSVSNVLGAARTAPTIAVRLDLTPLVADALAMAQPYLDHHGVILRRDLTDEALWVKADAGEFRQVLLNVLMNACEATPRGGRVTVSTGRHERDVFVEATDTGCGLSAEAEARAFEPFYTTKPSGTGLGLAVCRDLLAQRGGSIRLTRVPAGGTSVLITMPADSSSWP